MINDSNKYFLDLDKFNKYFFYYIVSLSFFGIFYLYQKYSVANDTSISEYLINYQGGFTRRGFVGEILFFISDYFKLNLRFSIFLFQSIIYLTFLILIFKFFKKIKKNILIAFAIFTPIFLLFPIAEIESLGRKESILYIFFLILVNINNSKNANLFTLLFLPIVSLIYEQIILFSGFIFAVLVIKNKSTNFFQVTKIFLIFVPAIIINFIFLLYPLSLDNHKIMSDALMSTFNETCYMSCSLLVNNNINDYSEMINYIWSGVDLKFKLIIFFRYFLIILIGFFPIFLLSYNSVFKKKNFFSILKLNNVLFLIFFLYIPIIPLFLLGGDWGRWIGMTITFTTIFYFYLYQNDIISINYFSVSKKLSFLKNKRKLIILIFILFAFSWNQKTTSREDVATLPGYKIPYKTVKIIFDLKGLRIFQDSFLLKWHKKYIE